MNLDEQVRHSNSEGGNKNEASEKKIETKYKEPNRLDKAPYGQIWKVVGEEGEVAVWIQVSPIEDESNWVNISAIFSKDIQKIVFKSRPEFNYPFDEI